MNREIKNNISFKEVITRIEKARNNAFKKVNEELINLYWDVGKMLSIKISNSEWGDSVVNDLATFIKNNYPEMKGFNRRGLYRMKQFYETYRDNQKVSSLRTQISWTHHRLILSKTKSIEEKEFYINLAIKERYSSRELERQINKCVFERTMLADNKLDIINSNLPQDVSKVFKDTYLFEFLDVPKIHNEKDLQKALVKNLKEFILELGKSFSFIGEEYRVQAGNHDYYIDLLFFHREMQCLVAIELKVVEFEPEFLGKMNFYLELLDREIKMPHENPSIGLLLCKGKNDEIVEIALSRNISPTMIADYETKIIDKKLLKKKLHEWSELYESKDKEKQ
ncbi:PDDEXK nuclease domain-containing protein [Wukongibacter sp. M2B1]|uniref:PDDEXK nuclease domain-containing protein n=1 Tax=Wukongibacter sp. M2B1 TaxID=3088895 RepID=UPI003D7B2016